MKYVVHFAGTPSAEHVSLCGQVINGDQSGLESWQWKYSLCPYCEVLDRLEAAPYYLVEEIT